MMINPPPPPPLLSLLHNPTFVSSPFSLFHRVTNSQYDRLDAGATG